ncbi:hypothetical protein [Streptomyces enissocaesilis]|uniref:Uncharacterized protein n=1 Tax=Streptomyces enissocaesilis TaxID=332589 RepID=A0ABN3XG72_9ACTN
MPTFSSKDRGAVLLAGERHRGAASGLPLPAVNRVPYAGATTAGSLPTTAAPVTTPGHARTPFTAIAPSGLPGVSGGVAMAVGNAPPQKETEPRHLGAVGST